MFLGDKDRVWKKLRGIFRKVMASKLYWEEVRSLDYLKQKTERSWNDISQDSINVPLNSDISHSVLQCNVTVYTLNSFQLLNWRHLACMTAAKISLVYTNNVKLIWGVNIWFILLLL